MHQMIYIKKIKTRKIVSKIIQPLKLHFMKNVRLKTPIHCIIKNCSVTDNAKKNNRKYQSSGEDVGFSDENAETVTVVRRGTVTVVGEWRG